MGIAAIHRPILAAGAGALRLIGFVLYARGYQTGDPKKVRVWRFLPCALSPETSPLGVELKKRMQGAVGYIGLLALLGVDIELGVRLIMS